MKATLEFDMNEPDDIMAHLRCAKSLDMALVIWEIVHNTKKGLEYAIEGHTDIYSVLEITFDKIYEILEEHDVNIDKLIN